MDAEELSVALEFAVGAAKAAGDLTLEHYRSDTGYEMKADNTPVTAADRGAEELLRSRIEAAYPGHGILGEEFGEKQGSEPARWILDPIDGTFSFICRAPLYCVLVGLEWEGEMVAGVIHMPAMGETVYAAKGQGCRWDGPGFTGRKASVSQTGDLSQARMMHGGTKLMRRFGKYEGFSRLCEEVYAERGWCDGFAYLLLATGRAEIMLDPILSIWDTAALGPVVTEAGGTLTDWSGAVDHTAPEAVGTNGLLFEPVMRALRGY